jgi:hypothetical protein
VADPDASTRITLCHLLHHTSGQPESADYAAFVNPDLGDGALEDGVRNLRSVELSQLVGAGYQYSNSGYAILGLAVETVSGQPYEDYVDEQIFDPYRCATHTPRSSRRDSTEWQPVIDSCSADPGSRRAPRAPRANLGGSDERDHRTHPERRPRPAIGVIRVLVPLLTNLTLLWAILNKAAGLTPDSVLLIRRFGGDIGWALLISGAVALSWGVILRPTLTALALHPRPRSEASKTQPLAQKRSTLCGNTDE